MFSQLFFYLISFFLSLSVLAMNQDAAVSSSTTLVPLVPSYAALVAKSRYEHLLQTIKTEDDKLEKAYIRCFQIATRHLYNSFHFPKGTVTVLVHNASDGVGDYAHGITVCNEIAAAFPHVTLSLHAFFEQDLDHLPPLPLPHSEQCQTYRYPEYKQVAPDCFEDLKKTLQKASSILEVSYEIDRDKELALTERRIEPKYTFLKEYGCLLSSLQDPWHNLSMGLSFESEGIFFKDMPFQPLFNLRNERLCKLLFNTLQPSQQDTERYHAQRHLHLFYHKLDCFYIVSDLYICAEYHKTDTKPIDILLPLEYSLEWLIEYEVLDLEVLKNLGIKNITYVKDTIIKDIPIAPTGKEMRIIHPGFIPQSDFYILACNCEEPFGGTGDSTFSEGLCLQPPKPLHYELRSNKTALFYTWQRLAQLHGWPLIATYLDCSTTFYNERTEVFYTQFQKASWMDEYKTKLLASMGKKIAPGAKALVLILRNPQFKEQWTQMTNFLHTHYDIRPHLRDIVARHLAFAHIPHLHELEAHLYQEFRKGTKSLKQVCKELKEFLDTWHASYIK